MKNVLKMGSCTMTSSANVVDGKLILSFPEAKTPVVWQMDLTQAKASALEVNEGSEEGTFTLTLKNPKAETVQIACFEKRDQAVGGLMSASRALENAHGQIRPVTMGDNSAPSQHAHPRPRGRWMPAILGIALLLVLFFIWGSMQPKPPRSLSSSSASNSFAPPSDTAGVPMSADDFLRGQ